MKPIAFINQLCRDNGIKIKGNYPIKKHNVKGEIPETIGLYVLRDAQGREYVGKSVCMSTRIGQHRSYGTEFVTGVAIELPVDRVRLAVMEEQVIRACKPELNTKMV